MKKFAIYVSLAFGVLLFAGTVLAHDGTAAVTAVDLGISEPTFLPTSFFYFVKEWGRGIQLFFTFNAVSKADLQLRFADEKLLEAKAVVDANPEDTQALAKALANYKDSADRLSARLQGLKDTSQNPNVDKLLTKLADRVVKHEKLFEELKESATTTAEKDINDAQDELGKGLLGAGGRLEDNQKIVTRLEDAAQGAKTGSGLEKIQSAELFDRLENQAENADAKELLRKARENYSDEVKNALEGELKSTSTEAVIEQLKAIPGDAMLRAQIIDEIKFRASGGDKESLEDISKGFEKEIEKAIDIQEKAQEQIKEADEKISELSSSMVKNGDKVTDAVKTQFNQAADKLTLAIKAFSDKNYGEAFGQAQAAEVLERNALRVIEGAGRKERERKDRKEIPESKSGERKATGTPEAEKESSERVFPKKETPENPETPLNMD